MVISMDEERYDRFTPDGHGIAARAVCLHLKFLYKICVYAGVLKISIKFVSYALRLSRSFASSFLQPASRSLSDLPVAAAFRRFEYAIVRDDDPSSSYRDSISERSGRALSNFARPASMGDPCRYIVVNPLLTYNRRLI